MFMRTDHYFESRGEGKIHYCRWMPEEQVRAVVQIVHGIAEYVERYDDLANYLNCHGIAVVAEDHMGHGKSISRETTQGYFAGGWFTAVADTVQLMNLTQAEFPGVPYILFGHSMGSFMARTILAKYPDSGIAAAVICGTGWMNTAVLQIGKAACEGACRRNGDRQPNESLQNLVFGGYNKRVEHPRTAYDWLNRNPRCVDAYIADPLCGFTASAGLLRDMLTGMLYIQKAESLKTMKKDLPVFFIAGGDDPVGNYGQGVRLAADKFRKAGMQDVSVRVYPLCRHEILNEINKKEIYEDVLQWIAKYADNS